LGSYAYVAGDGVVFREIVGRRVSVPGEGGFVETPDFAEGVAVSGSYAYVADGGGGLRVIDVSTPSAPEKVGYADTLGYVHGVAVAGIYAYVGGYVGLAVFQGCTVFEDGFESGDTSAWSGTLP
jgi:hypothetical protein